MKTYSWPWVGAILVVTCLLANDLYAIGGRGGGGGHPGGGHPGGGGVGRPGGGGGARPSPNISRPSPSMNRPSPNVSRPSPNISRPSPNISRPSPNISRPNPSISRPSPNINRPSTPIARPSTPQVRPTPSRPGSGSIPNLGGGGSPWAGGNRPGGATTLPGNVTRPGNWPGNRPDFAGGGTRPDFNRPNINRPETRPTPGGVGDFLGIPGGLKPGDITKPATRPGFAGGGVDKFPNRPETRPGGGGGGIDKFPNRPETRPGFAGGGTDKFPNRPNVQRPDNLRPNINNRPSWVNINNNQINNIHNQWNTGINKPGMNNWINNHPDRGQHWNNWANNVHHHWNGYNRPWFNNNWWAYHGNLNCGWHYHYWNHNYPWNYWWRAPVWTGVTGWFGNWGWSQPIYYDYGTGGNVVYNNDTVYINQQPVASSAEFAQSAAALATVAPPEDEAVAEKTEWMPLGTFTLSTSEEDTNPSRILQLAVSKDGIVSGTMYNTSTDKSFAIQGQVDKQTQRVAFRIGEGDNAVAETGIYNLTQDETPLLVHFGPDKSETYLLVRQKAPEESSDDGGTNF